MKKETNSKNNGFELDDFWGFSDSNVQNNKNGAEDEWSFDDLFAAKEEKEVTRQEEERLAQERAAAREATRRQIEAEFAAKKRAEEEAAAAKAEAESRMKAEDAEKERLRLQAEEKAKMSQTRRKPIRVEGTGQQPDPEEFSDTSATSLNRLKPEIHLTADPALLMDAPDNGPMQTYLRRNGIAADRGYVMFALRPWEGFQGKLDDLAAACTYVYEQYGRTPVLYAMEPRKDEAANAAVAKKLRCPYVQLSAGQDGRQVLALVKQMDAVVSMRLHSLIFAAGQGVPVVGVVYDPKVSGFLDYLGQKRYLSLEDVTAQDLKALIDQALTQKAADEAAIERLRSLAAENAQLAKALLEG